MTLCHQLQPMSQRVSKMSLLQSLPSPPCPWLQSQLRSCLHPGLGLTSSLPSLPSDNASHPDTWPQQGFSRLSAESESPLLTAPTALQSPLSKPQCPQPGSQTPRLLTLPSLPPLWCLRCSCQVAGVGALPPTCLPASLSSQHISARLPGHLLSDQPQLNPLVSGNLT